ncbi:DNA methyltransferase [Sphingorhabdus arenilitoris]|uniref:DNA methyltransferase n=1 Tax=Sphingorhabdus arenilitoris TaxID=1490041 RepID=A0ABV8RDG5_9SPHN
MLDRRFISSQSWGANIEFPSSRELRGSPHYVGGRYPCRSVAFVPRMILQKTAEVKRDFAVLDPFMGSGTTAIEAGTLANAVYGVEVDAYARLIATASTTPLSRQSIERLYRVLDDIEKAGAVAGDPKLRPSLANIEYWFTEQSFDELLSLKSYLFGLGLDVAEHNLLLTAFGDIIRACSKAERQSLKPYISTKYDKQIKPTIPEFQKVARQYLNAIEKLDPTDFCAIEWLGHDATAFEAEAPIDLAITSPPYINAMDYTRCIKLESAWIGTCDDASLQKTKSLQLGEASRRHQSVENWIDELCRSKFGRLLELDNARFGTAVAYFDDMAKNLSSVQQALTEDGKYYLIIGNSRLRGVEIETHRIIAEIAIMLGFDWSGYFTYKIKDHRTSIPRGDRGGKIDIEHVVELTKNKNS